MGLLRASIESILGILPVCVTRPLGASPRTGYYLVTMPIEPDIKRTVAYFDGQNFFRCAQEAFDLTHPSFDPIKLAYEICKEQSWSIEQVRFYTGMPDKVKDPLWHHFWTEKLRVIGRNRKAKVITRPLRYRTTQVELSDGSAETVEYKVEKGIDVRIAIDIVRAGINFEFDVALIFSQDQDLAEVVQDVIDCAKERDKWVKLACAFPVSDTYKNKRGINKTDWLEIDRFLYDRCLDPANYRPKSKVQRR